jgi:hypothetical protein
MTILIYQNVRLDEGQYDVGRTAIWLSVPGELNGDILKFLSKKALIGFKSVSKSTKSAVKIEKGKIYTTIGEQLNEIIENCQLRSVPNEHKFRV